MKTVIGGELSDRVPQNVKSYGVAAPENKVVASYTSFMGEDFNPYYETMFRSLLDSSNRSFFPQYYLSYRNNTYTSFACDYLYGQIMGYGWHVEGPGARKVKRFFSADNTYDKINYTLSPVGGATTYGVGILDLKTRGNQLIGTRPLNPLQIGGFFDPSLGETRYFYSGDVAYKGEFLTESVYLNKENLFINSLHYDPYEPFPTPPLRSSLLFFTILYDMNGDIAEAVKRVAYAPFIIYVNTDGVDESMKDNFITEMSKTIDNALSASTNLCLDDRHKAGTAGSLGGGGSAQLLPVDTLMVPMMSISFTQFSIPLGLIMQQGANKSLMDKQMESCQKQIIVRQERFANTVEALLQKITSQDVSFEWNVPTPSNSEMANLRKHYLELLEAGIVDANYIRNKLDINVLFGNEQYQTEGVL